MAHRYADGSPLIGENIVATVLPPASPQVIEPDSAPGRARAVRRDRVRWRRREGSGERVVSPARRGDHHGRDILPGRQADPDRKWAAGLDVLGREDRQGATPLER